MRKRKLGAMSLSLSPRAPIAIHKKIPMRYLHDFCSLRVVPVFPPKSFAWGKKYGGYSSEYRMSLCQTPKSKLLDAATGNGQAKNRVVRPFTLGKLSFLCQSGSVNETASWILDLSHKRRRLSQCPWSIVHCNDPVHRFRFTD